MDGEELGKTRSQTNSEKNGEETKAPEENGKDKDEELEEEPDKEQNGNHAEEEKSPLKRTRTMEDTVKVCIQFMNTLARI